MPNIINEPLNSLDTDLNKARAEEYGKYQRAYRQSSYRMGNNRRNAAEKVIKDLPFRGSLLDVGCGRGEMVRIANELGFKSTGVDVVDYLLSGPLVYGEAHDLPFEDNAFDVVTSFDAFEHFLPEDTESALREINRVSRKAVVLCIALTPSMNLGETLHINLRSIKEWNKLISKCIDGQVGSPIKTNGNQSATWVIHKLPKE